MAERIYTDMKESGVVAPNDATYTSMIRVFVSLGRLDDGLALYQEMKSAGIQPTEDTYHALLNALCDAKKVWEAMNMFWEMAVKHIVPPYMTCVFLKVMTCYCESGDVHSAVDVLKIMDGMSIPAQVAHYAILIDTYCKSEAYDTAVEFLDELIEKEIIEKSSGYGDFETIAYSPIISYLCANGQTEKAETVFNLLKKRRVIYLSIILDLVHGYVREDSLDRATELVKFMDKHCKDWRRHVRGCTADREIEYVRWAPFMD